MFAFRVLTSVSISIWLLALAGCATTTSGGAVGANRSQLLLISSEQLEQTAALGYTKLKSEASQKGALNKDEKLLQRVQTIARRIEPQTAVFRKDAPGWKWEVNVIDSNELNAIEICHGYVEAQHEYALMKRGASVNQYAQRIISTPGKQDGLAWRNEDGTWGGPIGEKVAAAIERGYKNRTEPFHGYFFKVLKGQGPAAPLGELDFVVKDVMIGGFALVAFPAQYRVTGVQTFIVSHDGVVYQKDLGPKTSELAAAIERFNPDKSWTPVLEQ